MCAGHRCLTYSCELEMESFRRGSHIPVGVSIPCLPDSKAQAPWGNRKEGMTTHLRSGSYNQLIPGRQGHAVDTILTTHQVLVDASSSLPFLTYPNSYNLNSNPTQPSFTIGTTVITVVPLVSGSVSPSSQLPEILLNCQLISIISPQILLSLQDKVKKKNPAQEHRCLPYTFAFHQLPLSALLPQASCLWEIHYKVLSATSHRLQMGKDSVQKSILYIPGCSMLGGCGWEGKAWHNILSPPLAALCLHTQPGSN